MGGGVQVDIVADSDAIRTDAHDRLTKTTRFCALGVWPVLVHRQSVVESDIVAVSDAPPHV